MPTTNEILMSLTAISEDAIGLAIAWHVAIALALAAIVLGWRPRARTATVLLAAPMASVATLAFAYGNPFNGLVFAAAVIALVALAPDHPAIPATRWSTLAGLAMIAFGWAYPHFLESRAAAMSLVAAPVGLVPCPTLSIAIGFALLGAVDRRVAILLAGLGAFYGVFGAIRLGVTLDVGLIVGAGMLAALAWRERPAIAVARP